MSINDVLSIDDKQGKRRKDTILAIDPTIKGFGYVVFTPEDALLDWGATDIRVHINGRALLRIKKLCRMYQPDTLIIENPVYVGSRRSERIKQFVTRVREYCEKNGITAVLYSPSQVREVFCNFSAKTKYERAEKIAQWVLELTEYLPRKRKCYETEPAQYAVFDAAALVITHLYLLE